MAPTRLRRGVAAFALAAALAGCATAGAVRTARHAEERQDYDRAVVEYTRALQLDPSNADARTGLQRAKLRAAQDHFTLARRLAAGGKLDEAVAEYQLAAELNPGSREVVEELRATQNLLRAKVPVNRDGRTALEALVERMRTQPMPGLDVPNEPLPDAWTFREASNQDVLRAIAQVSKVNVIFDPAFTPSPITIDLRDMTFDRALNSITASTRTFYRVTAPRTITIIPDTPAKRREYEEQVVRTFYLSNADPKETMDVLRIVIAARAIAPTSATNAITVQDTPERVAAAARLITMLDKARPEVLIDVELIEVNRQKLDEYGLQLATSGSPGINGLADVNRTGFTLADLKNLSGSQVLLTALPGLYYRLLKSDQNTRVLANPQLRAQAGIPATATFGEDVPVPVTVFSPIATGGVAQQPITSFNYRNVGVAIEITPRIHLDNEVTLALAISVTSISGTGFGNLPTFGNREIKTQIRLKDGETNMLAGLIRDDERRLREGIPGLSDLPGIGRLLGHSRNERTQTDVILMLTPHIVRVLDLTEEDLRAFQLDGGPDGNVGSGSPAGGADFSPPRQLQPLPFPETRPLTPPQPQPVQPVLPPTPQQPTQPAPGAGPAAPAPQ